MLIKLTIEQMFDIITLGISQSWSYFILLNRPYNIIPILEVENMELEECIKDGFDDSLREFIHSEEYRTQKQGFRSPYEYWH